MSEKTWIITAYTPRSMANTAVEIRDRDRVLITWFGGNGPHEYRVREFEGEPYAVARDGFRVARLTEPVVVQSLTVLERAP